MSEPTRAPASILLVDDKPENLLALEAILQPLGRELVRAASGREALGLAAERDFALVLMDVRMPGLDGLQTAAEMKRQPRSLHTPIIFLTGNDSPFEIMEAYELGAVDFLAKPLEAAVLRAKVAVFIELFEQRDQLSREELNSQRSRRREAEEKLRASEERLRLLVDNMRAYALIVCDPAGTIVDWQGGAERITGYTAAEAVGRKLNLISTDEDRAAGMAELQIARAIADGRAEERRWHQKKDGTLFSADGVLVALRDEAGSLRGLGKVFQDVTDKALREEQVRQVAIEHARAAEANAKFRTFFEQGTNFAALLDLDGRVLEANRLCLDACGFKREDVIGKHFWECGWWNRSPILMEMVRRACESAGAAQPFRSESNYFVADGSERVLDLAVAPVTDDDGRALFIAATGTDVTERKRVELELHAANRRKDEFLATASHELRTPLNSILGWARLLRSGKLDPSGYLRGVETIERNARAQVQLIEDILDGSRVTTGQLRLEIRPLDMTALVRAALDAIRPAAEAKSIVLTVETDPMAARIVGDPDRLQQVVWNLANNAIKFTPKGGNVQVRLERIGSAVGLIVRDSGQGISPAFLPHVFEQFRQAEGSTSRRHGGLGLGLMLVRHLVEAHGGTVRAESEGEGRGATFTVSLPVRAVHAEPIAPITAAGIDRFAALSPANLEGVTVLVVDDEADARDLVATVLRANGALVTTAPSADHALELLARHSPMVLISDIGMPGVDGYTFLHRVRQHEGAAGIPAVALTAYAREEDRKLALEAGFRMHVAKPVEPAELLRVVAAVVRFPNGAARHE